MANLNTDEARLIAVHRAINELNRAELVDLGDVGDITIALGQVFDLDKVEAELNRNELKQLIRGFVAGMGATRLQPQSPVPYEWLGEEGGGHFVGGPTGGVALEQGNDSDFVTQSGVHDNE